MNKHVLLPFSLAIMALCTEASATTVVTYDLSLSSGHSAFTNTVTNAGGTVTNYALTSNPVAPGFTLSATDGSLSGQGTYTGYDGETLGGSTYDMSPYITGGDNGFKSGLTFSFNTAVNAFGFELGDWSTCCQPSSVYLSFDNGPAILLATALTSNNAQTSVFVSAINDTGTFTKVNVWGNGSGEYMVAGGLISYGAVGQNSLPPANVPEPITLALMGLGFAGMDYMRRRQAKA